MRNLQPFKEPVVERKACAACKTFAPEVLVPDGDAAVPMCWLCAHHVIEHGTALEHAHCAECECTPQEIYPHRTFEPPAEVVPELSPRERDRTKLLGGPPARLAAWAREAHKQMSDAQLAAVKRRLS